MGRQADWDVAHLDTEQRVSAIARDLDAHDRLDDGRFDALHDRFDRLEEKVERRLASIAGRATGAVIGVMTGIIVALSVALVLLK